MNRLDPSRYLAAERLIRDSELSAEQRAEVVTSLVQALVQALIAGQVSAPDSNGTQGQPEP